MSSVMFGQKTIRIRPPEKGSFPLDHKGECRVFMERYFACLNANKMDSGLCRSQSRDYLQCRMDHSLMSKDDFENLGYASSNSGDGGDKKPE